METTSRVQAYTFGRTEPHRVDCKSITTAFAAGFDVGFCAKAYAQTKSSLYFNSNSHRSWDAHGPRPAMMLSGRDINEVKNLIYHGVASDHTPTQYRLSRPHVRPKPQRRIFYFTGITHVTALGSVRFVPGAIADHLISAGGGALLSGGGQMGSLQCL